MNLGPASPDGPSDDAPLSRRDLLRRSGEYEMAKNRLAIGLLIVSYLGWEALFRHSDVQSALVLAVSGLCFAGVLTSSIVYSPRLSVVRRIISMTFDLGSLSYCLHFGGETTSVLFPIYLWVIFGNGFRFGNRYLLAATLISIGGFILVYWYTPFWMTKPHLVGGLLLGLAAIPAYAAKLIRDLNQAKAAAEHASKAKSRFLASISHEFRTPLHAIVGMSDLLLNSDIRPTHRDMLSTVRKSAQSLNALIDTILDFSRLESGRMPIKTETFSLDTVLGNVTRMLESQADKKDIRLGLTMDPHVPNRVHGSRSSLEAIIINLASNAVKFTNEGHVNILVYRKEEKHGLVRIHFEVADTGIGIAEDAQETVFEAFSQADDSILDRFGGTGLGLATAKQLALAQNGSIGVTSKLGKGTTFWFELPLEVRPPEAEIEHSDAPSAIVVSRRADIVRPIGEALAIVNAVTRIADDFAAAQAIIESASAGDTPMPIVLADWDTWQKSTEKEAQFLRETGATVILVDSDGLSRLEEVGDRNRFASFIAPDAGPEVLSRILTLTRHIRPAADETETSDSHIATARKALSILVADDNKTNRMVVAKILQMAGHQTLEAENGEQMLDLVTDSGCDVVLMDVNMPVMNGIEATKHLRVMEAGCTPTPVIGLTADGSEEMRQICAEAGMDACLTKPVNPPELLRALDRAANVSEHTISDTDPRPVDRPAPANDETPLPAGIDVDEAAVEDLVKLGGEAFARDVVSSFIGEAHATIDRIETALDRGDWGDFHDQAHALKSTSSNVGAIGLAGLCERSRLLPDRATTAERRAFVSTLRAALNRTVTSECVATLAEPDANRAAAV